MSIKWRPLSNLCFGDDIDLMADSTVSSRPSKTRLDKSKVMVNTIGQEKAEIHLNNTELKKVSFKYLKSMRSKDGSSAADIQYWILAATAAQARLNKIWDSRSISFITKFNPSCSHHAVWFPNVDTAEMDSRIQASETKCFRRLL